MWRTLSLLALPSLALACGFSTGVAEPHRSSIELALGQLLERSNDDAFVILEHTPSGRFVQFAGSVAEPLLLDLPRQALDPHETERAAALFRPHGVELAEWPVFDHPGGSVAGTQSGFQLEVGRDVQAAAEIALRVFAEVYRLPPDFELTIAEN